jgi:hypothetical protein
VVLCAAVQVVLAAGLPFGIAAGVVDALAVEVQPGDAALYVRGCGVFLGGLDLLVERVKGGLEAGLWGVAQGCGLVKGCPGGGLCFGAGHDADLAGLEGGFGVVVFDDVVEKDGDDGGEEDIVAGAQAHGDLAAYGKAAYDDRCGLTVIATSRHRFTASLSFLLAALNLLGDCKSLRPCIGCANSKINCHWITSPLRGFRRHEWIT